MSNFIAFDDHGGPKKRQRTDTADNEYNIDEERKARKVLAKYHEQELQLLQMQMNTQILLAGQSYVTEEQHSAMQQYQVELFKQQTKRKLEFEQNVKKVKKGVIDERNCEGFVKQWEGEKRYGFLKCAEIRSDIYFRLPPGKQAPAVATRCKFELQLNPEGRYQAHNVAFSSQQPGAGFMPVELIDGAALAAQVQQIQQLQQLQEAAQVQQSMLAQVNAQTELIQSEEARTAEEIYRRKNTKGSTQEICGDFQSGNCSRGAKCMYAHEKMESLRGFCHNFLRGTCSRGADCKYAHHRDEEGNPVDKFGNVHAHSSQGRKIVCFDFQHGNCIRGDECKYAHEIQEGTPAEKFGRNQGKGKTMALPRSADPPSFSQSSSGLPSFSPSPSDAMNAEGLPMPRPAGEVTTSGVLPVPRRSVGPMNAGVKPAQVLKGFRVDEAMAPSAKVMPKSSGKSSGKYSGTSASMSSNTPAKVSGGGLDFSFLDTQIPGWQSILGE